MSVPLQLQLLVNLCTCNTIYVSKYVQYFSSIFWSCVDMSSKCPTASHCCQPKNQLLLCDWSGRLHLVWSRGGVLRNSSTDSTRAGILQQIMILWSQICYLVEKQMITYLRIKGSLLFLLNSTQVCLVPETRQIMNKWTCLSFTEMCTSSG